MEGSKVGEVVGQPRVYRHLPGRGTAGSKQAPFPSQHRAPACRLFPRGNIVRKVYTRCNDPDRLPRASACQSAQVRAPARCSLQGKPRCTFRILYTRTDQSQPTVSAAFFEAAYADSCATSLIV